VRKTDGLEARLGKSTADTSDTYQLVNTMVLKIHGASLGADRDNTHHAEGLFQHNEKICGTVFGRLMVSTKHKGIVECQVECSGNL